ncbi:transcriptional regulator [Streptomyces kronopolitis]|uniref:transcriptional regulator n=1 Tax=Streptomyces kronopolitis TaxID=1612435 RepID=UPI00342B15B2
MAESMPEVDPVIHPMPRLSICSVLFAGPQWVEFSVVQEMTGLSASMVSKHSRVLEEGGYIEVRKGAVGRRPRTWFSLTGRGATRFQSHIAALTQLAAGPQ